MKTKMNKKFLSLILAVSMTLTSFAGLTVTTASAEGEPALSDWTLNSGTTVDFTSWSMPDNTGIENAADKDFMPTGSGTEDWTLWNNNSRHDATRISLTTDGSQVLVINYNGTAKFNVVPDADIFYYTYQLKSWSDSAAVSIEGLADTSAYTIGNIGNTKTTYTTVVDKKSGKAYTYKGTGSSAELAHTNTVADSDTITGIKFSNSTSENKAIRLFDVTYGTLVTPPDLSTFRLTAVDKDNSEKFTKTHDDLIAGNWKEYKNADLSNTVKDGSSVDSKTSSLGVKWNRNVTYTPSNSAEGMTYYKYTVLRDNVNKEGETPASFVYLAKTGSTKTETDYEALSIKADGDLALGTEGTFITVVDSKNKKAYTYKSGSLTTPIKTITIDTVTGIRFGNVDDYNGGMCLHIKSFEYGTLEEVPDTPAQAEDPTDLAINYENETINTTTALEYKVDAGAWTACAANMAVTAFGWDGSEAVTVNFRTAAADGKTASEGNASVTIPARPTAPNAQGNKPASSGAQGTITGVDNTMEYILKSTFDGDSSAAWTPVPNEANSVSVAPDTYYVRVAAKADTNFVGEKATVPVPAYEAETYTIKGTISAAGSVSKVELKGNQNYTFNVTSGTDVTFENVLAGTYTVVVTPAEGYKNGTSNPEQITVSANADSAFTASATPQTYNISQKSITNGTITVDGGATTAAFGSTVSFVVSANAGYTVDTVTYTDAEGTPQTISENAGKYTFTMPAANTTLNATFKAEDPTKKLKYWIDQTMTDDDTQSITPSASLTAAAMQAQNWNFANTESANLVFRGDGVDFKNTQTATYTNSETDKPYYYQYTVRTYYLSRTELDDEEKIKLSGGSNTVLAQSLGYDAEHTYTTVVDPEAHKVYHYDGDNLVGSPIDYSESAPITGITFEVGHTGSSFRLKSFKYGVIGEVPQTPHDVTFSARENGSITVATDTEITSGSSVLSGTNVTVTVTPDQGYEVNTFTVGGEDKKSALNEGVYTFEMPDKDVAIAVTFKEKGVVDPKALLSYWEDQTMTQKSEDTFASSDAEATALKEKIVQELNGTDAIENWTFESKKSDGSTRADNTRVTATNTGELLITYDGAAIYTRYAETGAYYYKYTISMSAGASDGAYQTVSLTGIDNGTLFTSPSTGGSFTTVVSPTDNKAYTYDANGELVAEKTINLSENDKVTGIEFRSSNDSNKNIKVSNFAFGLIADAAEPVPDPTEKLSHWQGDDGMQDALYTEDFENSPSNETLQKALWTFEDGKEPSVRSKSQTDTTKVLEITNQKVVYARYAKKGAFYYTFVVRTYQGESETVQLEGVDGSVLVSSPINADTRYTVIVDPETDYAYVYKADGTLDKKVELGGNKVKGISFNTSGSGSKFWVDEFSYGLIGNAKDIGLPEEPAPEVTPTPAGAGSKLSDWTLTEAETEESFNDTSVDKLSKGQDWSFGNTTGAAFNKSHVTINNNGELVVNYYGTATYGVTDEENSFYYTYTVYTTDTTGIRDVSLAGTGGGVLLTSGEEITSTVQTFTTIVDGNSKKAYTYVHDGEGDGDFVSETAIGDLESIRGIAFRGGTENVSVAMNVDDVKFGLVNLELPKPPVDVVLTSNAVNNGEPLSAEGEYTVQADPFADSSFVFNEPYAVKDGSSLLYLTTTAVITAPEKADGNIVVDGLKVTAKEALEADDYDLTITVTSKFGNTVYGREEYTVTLKKAKVTNGQIEENYNPVITTENINGRTVKVNTRAEDKEDATEIYDNLSLPTKMSFADITWKSNEPDVISDKGEVTRPYDDTFVTLTATIVNKYNSSADPVKKTVKVLVKGVGSMLEDALDKAKAAIKKAYDEDADINIDGLTDLHQDIKLYTEYEKNDEYPEYNEVSIDWTSSNDAVLKINGDIAEIYPTTTGEYNLMLTIKVSALGQSTEEQIPVKIKLTPENAGGRYAVRCDNLADENFTDFSALSGTTVSSDVTVTKTTGRFGSNISWTSSAPNYLSHRGKYTAPSGDRSVTMTAALSKGTFMTDNARSYNLTVKGKNSNSSSGGSGGGGGSSSGGGSSFSMPAGTVTTPTFPTAASNEGNYNPNANTEPEGFTDLGNVSWAEEAINALADKGIISGRSEHIFDPDANITRAEFATIIVKAFGFEDADATVDEFADVTEDDWYYSFVAAAYNNGIISGYDNGSFGSYDNITRQDMAVIIYRAANAAGVELDEINEGKTFEDEASIAAYAADAVDALVKAGVINGMTDTTFAPTANATRAQAAKMTYELVK